MGFNCFLERQNEIEEADREINKYAYQAQEEDYEKGKAAIPVKGGRKMGKKGFWFKQ